MLSKDFLKILNLFTKGVGHLIERGRLAGFMFFEGEEDALFANFIFKNLV